MFFYKNCRCPVCGGVFSEDDDIVACPQCGAPHHRACWLSEGRCHHTDKHAEGFVWSREEAAPPPPVEEEWDEEDDEEFDETVERDTPSNDDEARPPRHCRRCGFPNPSGADFCSRCGAPLTERPPQGAGYGEYAPHHVTPPNPYGGVDPNERLAGETAEDMAAFVRANTAYYLPRWRDMDKTGRAVSWNWGGFICGPAWFLFRKRYVWGAVLTVLEVLTHVLMMLSSGLMMPFLDAMENGNIQQAIEQMQKMSYQQMLLAVLPTVAWAAIHLLGGLFGTRIYMQSCARSVNKLRTQNPYGYKAFLPAQGGVSFIIAVLAISAIMSLPKAIFLLL